MNEKALHSAAKRFLKDNPGGFDHPDLQEILNRHKTKEMAALVKKDFNKAAFEDVETVLNNAIRFVGKSSLISMFEKPKFKELVKGFSGKEKERFANALFDTLHGKMQSGFEQQLEILGRKKMAKWTLITVFSNYYRPKTDLLIKPTTTKLIIKELDLDLKYSPTPTWAFYQSYRRQINAMKKLVDPSLSPSNMAFCGFLMTELGN